jgi:hypothetical protein
MKSLRRYAHADLSTAVINPTSHCRSPKIALPQKTIANQSQIITINNEIHKLTNSISTGGALSLADGFLCTRRQPGPASKPVSAEDKSGTAGG